MAIAAVLHHRLLLPKIEGIDEKDQHGDARDHLLDLGRDPALGLVPGRNSSITIEGNAIVAVSNARIGIKVDQDTRMLIDIKNGEIIMRVMVTMTWITVVTVPKVTDNNSSNAWTADDLIVWTMNDPGDNERENNNCEIGVKEEGDEEVAVALPFRRDLPLLEEEGGHVLEV